MGKTYSKREWLNDNDSPSTGSVVCYHGPAKWNNKLKTVTFLEVADCQSKIRLHQSPEDTLYQFSSKMMKLRDEIDNFITFLEIENCLKECAECCYLVMIDIQGYCNLFDKKCREVSECDFQEGSPHEND